MASGEGAVLARATAKVAGAHARHAVEVAGEQLEKVPAPWSDAHPRADLLRRTSFQLRFIEELPDLVAKPAFAGWCARRLRALLPVHRWLVDALAA